MRGSVILDKRNANKKKPRYRVIVDERAPDGSRRRRWYSDPVTGSAFTSKKDADAFLAGLLASIDSGAYVPPAKDTLDAWLDTWLAIMQTKVKPSTYASYERVLRVHVRPVLGNKPLQKITAADLDRLYASMLAGGRSDYRQGEGLSPRTVRYCSTILGRALKDAARKGLIQNNPATLADPPRAGKTAPGAAKAWTAEELAAFLSATQDDYYGPVWAFLASTGCRRGEALGLRWRDVDFETRRVSLLQSVQKVAGKLLIGETKTAASARPLVLDGDTIELLKGLRRQQAETRLAVGPGWVDNDLVFAGPTGEPLYPETVSKTFTAVVRRMGLPAIRLHGLRHTWATIALKAGVHPKVVQERLGHANVSITLNIYSHVAPVMHDDAAERVAGIVRSAKAVDGR